MQSEIKNGSSNQWSFGNKLFNESQNENKSPR